MIIFKFHLFYWVMAFICALTGYFKHFILFTLLIIIHELGHITGALIFKWKIKKVLILPLGGLTIFDEYLSKSIFEEFIILIMGPLYQIIFYYLFIFIFGYNELLNSYNYYLLVFNFLPIFPLDGSKLVNIILNKFFSFKFSHLVTLYISYIFLIISIIYILKYKINLIMFFSILIIFFKSMKELCNHKLIFNKFLLERYLYHFNFKKLKIIKSENIKKMKRDYKHIFYCNQEYVTEKNILKKKFDIKSKVC